MLDISQSTKKSLVFYHNFNNTLTNNDVVLQKITIPMARLHTASNPNHIEFAHYLIVD
jgi:hypothetical protein